MHDPARVYRSKAPLRLFAVVALIFVGCGGGSGDSSAGNPRFGTPAGTDADISLLFMGNSHASVNNLQGLVVAMVQAARPAKSVAAVEAPGWMFLEERLDDAPSVNLLRSQDWSFVILQAQKYSSSGQFEYSTAEAEEFIRMARQQDAIPIMFPEWPRLGVDETMRIYDLHVSIAQREVACVAPIGQAWGLSLARDPALVLHASDGNHSNPAGAFLAALILYATVTGESPLAIPPLPQFPVDVATQAQLRAVADETVQVWPSRAWCPSDPFP
ncbi:MAG TPA: hypothetical protein VJ764_02455 [Steroidobacteraceae bacterium]|nr:hypothetical protein [Steroidobacteraceae bacterium]